MRKNALQLRVVYSGPITRGDIRTGEGICCPLSGTSRSYGASPSCRSASGLSKGPSSFECAQHMRTPRPSGERMCRKALLPFGSEGCHDGSLLSVCLSVLSVKHTSVLSVKHMIRRMFGSEGCHDIPFSKGCHESSPPVQTAHGERLQGHLAHKKHPPP